MTQESLTSVVTVSERPAHADFMSGVGQQFADGLSMQAAAIMLVAVVEVKYS